MINLNLILDINYSDNLILNELNYNSSLNKLNLIELKSLHFYLNSNLLPLISHSYSSLPKNWNYLRPLISKSLTYPYKFYLPEQFRSNLKELILNLKPEYWNLGGQVEKEEEEERKKKRLLLETGSDAWKERQDEEIRTRKNTIKQSFGKNKIEESANKVFAALEKQLSLSSTPYFFSSPTPTSLDIHLSSLLSLLLYIPLPQSILADQLNKHHSKLVAHTELLTDKSILTNPPTFSILNESTTSSSTSLSSLLPSLSDLTNLLPDFLNLNNTPTILPTKSTSKKSETTKTSTELKELKDFKKKRLMFFGLVTFGVITWGLGTGAFGLLLEGLNSPGSSEGEGGEEEVEWEVVEEYVR